MKPGITDVGYQCSTDVVLNIQCVKCGTWLGFEEGKLIDWQGSSHHCAGEPYGKAKQSELEL